jgi:hypothetical protein
MPKPWDQERIGRAIETLLELLDTTDLDDEEAVRVCEILLSKLWRRSGLDVFAFRSAVTSALHRPPPGPLQ